MKELNKKKIAILIIVVLLIIAGIIAAVIFANPKENKEDKDALNTSEFDNMKAKDLNVRYDEEANQTYVDLKIKSLVKHNIEKETVDVMLLDENDNQIAGVQEYIDVITPGDEFSIHISLGGNITGIKKVSLERPTIAVDL